MILRHRPAVPGRAEKGISYPAEHAGILKDYGITEIVSDRWGGVWVEDAFKKYRIRVTPSDLSASDLYLEFQPRLSSGQLVLLNDEKLKLQLRQLERRPHPGGRDKVDHPALAGFYDDVANAAAGAVIFAVKSMRGVWTPEQMEAWMPRAVQRLPDALRLPGQRAREILRSCQEEMDEWMRSEGGSRINKAMSLDIPPQNSRFSQGYSIIQVGRGSRHRGEQSRKFRFSCYWPRANRYPVLG